MLSDAIFLCARSGRYRSPTNFACWLNMESMNVRERFIGGDKSVSALSAVPLQHAFPWCAR